MIPSWYLHFLDVVVFSVAVSQTLFVLVYGLKAPWWETPIGRALMFKGFGLAAIFDLAATTRIFGEDYPGRFYVAALLFTIVAVGSWYQTVVVTREILFNREPLAEREHMES